MKTDAEEWLTSCAGAKIDFEYGKTYRVEAKYSYKSKLEREKGRAKEVLIRGEGNNGDKYNTYCKLLKAESMDEYLSIIETSNLPDIIKLRLKETL